MSGTSLDGLDLCFAQFQKDGSGNWSFEILNAETVSYSKFWLEKLKNAFDLSAEKIFELNAEYGFFLADAVSNFIKKNKISAVHVVASHGHTVFHRPEKKFTAQIGDGRAIRIKTGIPTVYDFRSQDVLVGGNGAPLVPIGDELLFAQYDACLNVGGFSNISLKRNGRRTAFDISPVNTVLNHYANLLGQPFDCDGQTARSNNVNESVLMQLNKLDFYSLQPPKSLGIEFVNENIFPLLKGISPEDALATFTEHCAQQISNVLSKFNVETVLITGGGAYNTHMLELIAGRSTTKLIIPQSEIIEFKEALIFAFMGALRLIGENNVLASATGASRDHCTGILV